MHIICFTLIFQSAFNGCKYSKPTDSASVTNQEYAELSYAKGFAVEEKDRYKIVSVFNPWQNSKGVVFQYVLGRDASVVPDSLSHLMFVKIPVKKVVTMSTTHIAFIDTLNVTESISGVSGGKYVYNDKLLNLIQKEIIKDIGFEQSLNYELIIALDPDVIFLFGVEGNIGGTIAKLKDLGLVPVMCGDYLETHPLGKTEWIKFFSEFYDLRQQADKIFSGIDSSYNAILKISSDKRIRPAVLSGLSWKNTWHVPGGKSFAARLIIDAGGNYLWSDNTSEEAVPLDMESVFMKAVNADIWINPGHIGALQDLYEFEERFRYLPAFVNGRVYNNDKRVNAYGGNDYWESGTLRPDLIIQDLHAIFYPEQAGDHQFIYYRKLK